MNKKCKHCLKIKPLTAFHIAPRHRFGVGSWCKECKNESDKNRSKNHKVNPFKDKVRHKFRYKVKNGEILKPKICSICGNKGKISGHHKDYNKPFDVIWLCCVCHYKIHH